MSTLPQRTPEDRLCASGNQVCIATERGDNYPLCGLSHHRRQHWKSISLRAVPELTTFLSLLLLNIPFFFHCVLEKSLEWQSRPSGLVPVSLELAVSCSANLQLPTCQMVGGGQPCKAEPGSLLSGGAGDFSPLLVSYASSPSTHWCRSSHGCCPVLLLQGPQNGGLRVWLTLSQTTP